MPTPPNSLVRRLSAEALGTALLLAVVVGSGIMGTNLGGGAAMTLLANSLATGAGLTVLILIFGPVSGAHFNPIVSIVAALRGALRWREACARVLAQCAGGSAGVMLAHAMFGVSLVSECTRPRPTVTGLLSEAVATFGLMLTIRACERHRPLTTPFAVGLYILSAYWFTSSTSFANPAVTLARTLTDSFAGIRLADAPSFVAGQIVGAAAAVLYSRWVDPD